LIDNLIMEINESGYAKIITHSMNISSDDKVRKSIPQRYTLHIEVQRAKKLPNWDLTPVAQLHGYRVKPGMTTDDLSPRAKTRGPSSKHGYRIKSGMTEGGWIATSQAPRDDGVGGKLLAMTDLDEGSSR
jgi:hypothetical protein